MKQLKKLKKLKSFYRFILIRIVKGVFLTGFPNCKSKYSRCGEYFRSSFHYLHSFYFLSNFHVSFSVRSMLPIGQIWKMATWRSKKVSQSCVASRSIYLTFSMVRKIFCFWKTTISLEHSRAIFILYLLEHSYKIDDSKHVYSIL